MRYRHWLLAAGAASILFSFVLIRLGVLLGTKYAIYGEADIYTGSAIAIACLAGWVVLESLYFTRVGSVGRCPCGYSLKGLKCPECGRDLG